MADIIKLICTIALGIVFLIEFIKNKKVYEFLGIIVAIIAIYFKTPFSNGISKTIENTLVGIMVTLAIAIFYLLIRDKRVKSEN